MRKNPFIYFFFIACSCCLLPRFSQAQQEGPSRAELEQQRNRLQNEIKKATEDLNEVQKNRKRTMVQLQLLQNKVALRNKLIANINKEINFINGDINKANRDINSLQKELDTLRTQYAKLIVYAYKNRNTYDFLSFVLSANSFNDAIKRFEYLKQYREYRQNQASSIINTQDQLKDKIKNLAAMKEKRGSVLTSEEGQREKIENEKQEKDDMVKSLKGHEKELMTNIQEKKKESRQLNVKIAAVIRREIEEAQRKAAEEARRRALAEARARAEAEARQPIAANNNDNKPDNNNASPGTPPKAAPLPVEPDNKPARPTNVLEATPATLALSESFEANKGKLPWPVSKAIVISTFGVHQHPVLEKITIDNNGITLQTEAGAVVHTIFSGEVASVFPISNKWTVVVKHGQYFSVYINLKTTSVQKGQNVKTGEALGTIFTDPITGESELEFQIYKSTQPVDPQQWLANL